MGNLTELKPQAFNESKLINFTLISTICVWVGLAPAYLTTAIIIGAVYQTISLLIAVICSATIMLVLLFLIKIYIIFSEKRKSERESGTNFRERANSLATVNAITENGINMNRLSMSKNQPIVYIQLISYYHKCLSFFQILDLLWLVQIVPLQSSLLAVVMVPPIPCSVQLYHPLAVIVSQAFQFHLSRSIT